MKFQFALGMLAVLCFLGVSCNEETSEQPATEAATQEKVGEAKEKICEPGALTEVGCNTCICNSDGSELACTKKICVGLEKDGEVKPQNLPATDGDAEVKPQNLPVPEAEVNKAEAEIPAVAKDRRRRRREAEEEDVCEPGKNFKKDCNDCECPASGKKSEAQICTTIAC